jgi:hypothetical protein
MRKLDIDSLFCLIANDNAPHDPRDYEDYDPAEPLEPYPDNATVDVVTFMSRWQG